MEHGCCSITKVAILCIFTDKHSKICLKEVLRTLTQVCQLKSQGQFSFNSFTYCSRTLRVFFFLNITLKEAKFFSKYFIVTGRKEKRKEARITTKKRMRYSKLCFERVHHCDTSKISTISSIFNDIFLFQKLK